MFSSFIKVFNNLFNPEVRKENLRKKNEFKIVKNSPWKSIEQLPTSFDKSKELFIVRFKNNKYQSYNLQFNPETGEIRNHWDEIVNKKRIAAFLILSLDDPNWRTDDARLAQKRERLDSANFFTQIGNQYHHCCIHDTGNRYGICLVFIGSFKRVMKPKRWIVLPQCFDVF